MLIVASKVPRRESKRVEFKERFDPNKKGDWCEIIKDIVAIANSGGGKILFGLKDSGEVSEVSVLALLEIDPALVTDKIAKYTGVQFANFEIASIRSSSKQIVELSIHASKIPIVFTEPGTYETEQGKQKTAFGRGTIYFRHGAKSEPANSRDLHEAFERLLSETRKSWLSGIRKISAVSPDFASALLPPEVIESRDGDAVKIRIVNDPRAPVYRKLDPDETHPYRQRDVVAQVNAASPELDRVRPYDVQCARRAFGVDSNADYFHKPKFGVPQYSQAFVDWLIDRYKTDPLFFKNAIKGAKQLTPREAN